MGPPQYVKGGLLMRPVGNNDSPTQSRAGRRRTAPMEMFKQGKRFHLSQTAELSS